MTLSPWDMADLDRLAAINADQGRHKASDAYHRHALGQGWHKHRAAFLAAWQRAAA